MAPETHPNVLTTLQLEDYAAVCCAVQNMTLSLHSGTAPAIPFERHEGRGLEPKRQCTRQRHTRHSLRSLTALVVLGVLGCSGSHCSGSEKAQNHPADHPASSCNHVHTSLSSQATRGRSRVFPLHTMSCPGISGDSQLIVGLFSAGVGLKWSTGGVTRKTAFRELGATSPVHPHSTAQSTQQMWTVVQHCGCSRLELRLLASGKRIPTRVSAVFGCHAATPQLLFATRAPSGVSLAPAGMPSPAALQCHCTIAVSLYTISVSLYTIAVSSYTIAVSLYNRPGPVWVERSRAL